MKTQEKDKELNMVLSVEEVAAQLYVTEETVRRWCRAGELGHYKIGNHIRVKGSDLKEYIEGQYRPRRAG